MVHGMSLKNVSGQSYKVTIRNFGSSLVSPKNLVLFLKERKIKSVDEMVELAEQYMEAHTVSDVHTVCLLK